MFPFNRIVDDVLQLLRQKGFASFQGVSPLPDLKISGRSGNFWTGRRNLLPAFHGIRGVPTMSLTGRSGKFFED